MDFDSARKLSDAISHFPLIRAQRLFEFGIPEEDDRFRGVRPFSLVYITASTDPQVSITPIRQTLYSLLSKKRDVKLKAPQVFRETWANIEVSAFPDQRKNGPKPVYEIQKWYTRSKYIFARYSNINAYDFEMDGVDLTHLITQSAREILFRMRGRRGKKESDCYLCAVTTGVLTGRMEVVSLEKGSEMRKVHVVDDSIKSSAHCKSFSYDSKRDAVIGITMCCFILERENEQTNSWMMSAPFPVEKWDSPMFHEAVAYCHRKSKKKFFLEHTFVVPKEDKAPKVIQFTRERSTDNDSDLDLSEFQRVDLKHYSSYAEAARAALISSSS